VFDIAHVVIRDLYRMFKTVKPEEMWEMLHVWGKRGIRTWILKENMNFRDYLEDLDLDGKIILK
jgi:hypothetical protein